MKQKTSKTTKKQQKLQDDNFIMNLTFDDRMKGYNDNMLNVLGYLEFVTPQFSHQITEHDGWFFAQQARIINETGVNERSLQRYLNKFVADGLIEYHAGKRTKDGTFSSEFKLNWEYKLLDIFEDSTSSNTLSEATQLIGDNLKNRIGDKIGDNLNTTLNNNDLQNEFIGDKNTSVTSEYRIQKSEVRIKNKEVRNMNSVIEKGSIDVTREKNLKDLNCFVLRFLDTVSRVEGIELYRDFVNTHKLQDDEMEFLATYTSKVGEVKGWKQTTTNNTSSEETEELNGNVNTSSTEEETRFTTTATTSSFKTPSELDFLGDFNEEVEEVTTRTEKDAKTSVSSSEEKKYTVDWSVNLNTAKCYFKQTAYRYAKQWMNLSDEEREKRFVSVVEGGFPEDTFAPFEKYIKGITLEKATEFADIVNEEANKYQVALRNGIPTTSNEDDAEYFSDVVENYAVENEKLNEQMEQTSAYIYNLLGW